MQLQHRQWNEALSLQNSEHQQHQGPRSGPPNTDVLFSPPPTIFFNTNKAQQPALYIVCNCVICLISHLTDWSTMGMSDCRSFATLNLTFGTLQRYAQHVKTKMFS